MLLRTGIAVNQLSIFGAVADWCQDFAQRAEGHTVRLVANESDDEAPKVPSEHASHLTKNSILGTPKP